jgi:hypothetical protein
VNARNTKAYGLERSWNHVKGLTEKVAGKCAKPESAYETPRKPNPRGRPKYRLSLVNWYGFIKNHTRIKQMTAEKVSSATRKTCSEIQGASYLAYYS